MVIWSLLVDALARELDERVEVCDFAEQTVTAPTD